MNLKPERETEGETVGGTGPGSSEGARPAGRGVTRRRGARLEGAILDAAWEVLNEHGYSGFTYESIAARAGTSRPVLYRRWARREDLLLATLARHWQPIDVPDTGTLRGDAIGFLRNANSARARAVILMSVQLGEYFRAHGTSYDELREALRPPGLAPPFEQIVDRAVQRGELPRRPDSPRVVNLPFDLLRHEMLMTLGPVSDETVAEIVDRVWLPLLGTTTSSR